MRNQLTRSDLPDADLTFIASRANKFIIVAEADSCYSVFVSIIDLPEWAGTFDLKGADAPICPTRDNDFICEEGAEWRHTCLCKDWASCYNWVIIGVPESDGAILWASRELVWHTWHKIGIYYCLSMVLTKEHFREITYSHAIDKTLICWRQNLKAV